MVDMDMDVGGSSKKKFVVPLAILLLCTVSLTGAGYAYTALSDGQGSLTQSEYYLISFDNSKYTAEFNFDGVVKYDTESKFNPDKPGEVIKVFKLKGEILSDTVSVYSFNNKNPTELSTDDYFTVAVDKCTGKLFKKDGKTEVAGVSFSFDVSNNSAKLKQDIEVTITVSGDGIVVDEKDVNEGFKVVLHVETIHADPPSNDGNQN